MMAEIKEDHVIPFAQWAPKWQVTVIRQTVAVAEHQPRPSGIAVPAHKNQRAVGHSEFQRLMRSRNRNHYCIISRHVSAAVDVDRTAGDMCRRRRAQKHDRSGDLLGISQPDRTRDDAGEGRLLRA